MPRATSAQSTETGTEAEVLAQEKRLAEAVRMRDRTSVEQLLAEDYVLRGNSDLDREAWIARALSECATKYPSGITGLRVREAGAVAVASFELVLHVDPQTCQPALYKSLVTDVWTRDAGRWQLVVRHASPAPVSQQGLAGQFQRVDTPPPEWQISGDLSLVTTSGNTATRTIGLNHSVRHQEGPVDTRFDVSFLSTDASSETQARALSVQLRQGRRVRTRLDVFGRVAYARDRFAGLIDRVAPDVGVAYRPVMPSRQSLALEGGGGYASEHRIDSPTRRYAFASAAIAYRWKIRSGTDFREDLAVHSGLEAARNWRLTNAAALTFGLTRLLAFKLSNSLEYRNDPVPGFRTTDVRTAAALVITFSSSTPANP